MGAMRPLLLLALVAMLSPPVGAAVIRCADDAGNVSYTDGNCPPGAKPVGRVATPEPSPAPRAERERQEPQADTSRASPPRREPTEASATPPVPSGPIIIDGSRTGSSSASARAGDSEVIDYGYPSQGAYYGPPARQRDMRPRIRSCDANGCHDTQGNHYNRSGQLDRYQSLDGKTCRPVGTTTICR